MFTRIGGTKKKGRERKKKLRKGAREKRATKERCKAAAEA